MDVSGMTQITLDTAVAANPIIVGHWMEPNEWSEMHFNS